MHDTMHFVIMRDFINFIAILIEADFAQKNITNIYECRFIKTLLFHRLNKKRKASTNKSQNFQQKTQFRTLKSCEGSY